MVPEQNRRNRWWAIFPLLGLVLVLGLVAFAVRAAGGSGGAASLSNGPQPNRPSGAAVSTTDSGLPYGPAQIETYPNGVTVIHDSKHDVSPPLRDIVPIPPVANADSAPENPRPGGPLPASLKDTVVQRFFGPLVMPTPSLTFDGISSTTSGCGCLPPDTNGDVGPNNYVQTTNSSFAIWDKSGNVIQAPRTIVTLFSGFGGPCSTHNDGDPTVNYDSLADRWVISQFTSSAPYYQCFAVSTTGDPTGAYYRYAFLESQTDLYDYPKTSVWPDAYYMTANVFLGGQTGAGARAFAFDRVRMLAGQAATAQVFNPGNFYYAMLPGDLDGPNAPPTGAPNPFITVAGNNTLVHIWKFHVDWVTPANSTFTGPTNLAAAPWDPNLCGSARNCIPQPGTAVRLDSLNDHTMYRFAYRNMGNYQTSVVTEAVDENGQDHAGIRWYEIRDPAGNPSIYQQGTYAPNATNRWMSSGAMDHDGNIAIGYSTSSATAGDFPSIRYAGRLASDPLGQLAQGEATLFAGAGSQTSTSNRWGDYSAMQVDPSDDCTFWYTNEYYSSTSASSWKTRVGKFSFPSCGQGLPTPTAQPTTPPVTPSPTPIACTTYGQPTVGTGVIVPGTTDIGNHCDDCSTLITLPFAVNLYGGSFTTAYVTSNGVIEFNSSDYAFGSACLPVPIYNYAVLGYWDDLITQGTGLGVFTSVTGIAPNRIFNVEWRAQVLANSSALNFEIQFPEGSANFSIIYGASVGQGGTNAVVGVQQDAGAFTQFLCHTSGLTAGEMLTFTAPPCATATATVPVPTSTATSTTVPVATATVTPGGATVTPCPIQFMDVSVNDPFYTYIRCLACRNILSGYSTSPPCAAGGTPCFNGGANVTRGQVAKIVANAAGYTDPIPSTTQTFTDVPFTNPFWVYIERLAEPGRGYISGYTTSPPCTTGTPCFLPFNSVTRGQMAKIDANAGGFFDAIPSTRQTFTDVPFSNPFWVYIERASLHGVISGYSTSPPCPGAHPCFLWANNLTRNQAAKIVAVTFYPNCQTPQR